MNTPEESKRRERRAANEARLLEVLRNDAEGRTPPTDGDIEDLDLDIYFQLFHGMRAMPEPRRGDPRTEER